MTKKYEITDTVHPTKPHLRRIRALRDIPVIGVDAGDLGGWIEQEYNLDQHGGAWVSDESEVSNCAQVTDAAQVFDGSLVSGNALLNCDMQVGGGANVSRNWHVLYAEVMASVRFPATLFRTENGHYLRVGCWEGTVPEFRRMIEYEKWVEATPDQIELRRPELLAFTAMCEARIATWEQP